MSNLNLSKTLIVGVIAFAITLFYIHNFKKNSLSQTRDSKNTIVNDAAKAPDVETLGTENKKNNTVAVDPAIAPSNSPDQPAKFLFGENINKIAECLGVKNTAGPDAELKFQDLNDALKSDLGEIESNLLQWQNVHFTTPSGELRRIRMEPEGLGEEASHRVLKLYSVDNEGLPVPMETPKNSTLNSLIGNGRVYLSEIALTGNFENGATLYYTERNGFLNKIEIQNGNHGVVCDKLLTQGNCRCL